jgi:RHS repeat-associated protein
MMPAAKHFDPILGVDIHIIQPPGPVPPVPIPHPYVGIVFDAFDYVPVLGSTVNVNGVPRAIAGSSGKVATGMHFPIGGSFVKPPSNESEVFMGSSTVSLDGDAASYLALPVLSCQDVGMVAPFRSNPRKKTKTKSLVLPASVVLAIPGGPPVLIGGPPTISMMALGMRAGLSLITGLRNLAKAGKLGKGVQNALEKASNAMHNAAERILRRAPERARNMVHSAICTLTGHPVDVATGKVFAFDIDFRIPGFLSIEFRRTYNSACASHDSQIGHGWTHNFDRVIRIITDEDEKFLLYKDSEGRDLDFDYISDRQQVTSTIDRIRLERSEDRITVIEQDQMLVFMDLEGDGRLFKLVQILDFNNNSIKLEYYNNQLAKIVDSAGREICFVYDNTGRICEIGLLVDKSSSQTIRLMSYTYDGIGNLIEAIDQSGNRCRYYYFGHLLTRETNKEGYSFYFEYDDKEYCIKTYGEDGLFYRSLAYDLESKITTVTNSKGFSTTYRYNEFGLVTEEKDALGGVQLTEWDEYGQRVSFTDQNGNQTKWQYDRQGNLLEYTDPMGYRTGYDYDERGRIIRITNPKGYSYSKTYARQVIERDPSGNEWKYECDKRGSVTRITDPKGNSNVFEYDRYGNLVKYRDALGGTVEYGYDHMGRVVQITDQAGNTYKYFYNGDNITKVIRPNGTYACYEYNAEDELRRYIDFKGRAILIKYKGYHQVAETIDSLGYSVRYSYDKEDNITAITNEKGEVATFSYDECDRLKSQTFFDGRQQEYFYDPCGLLIAEKDSSGLEVTYSYNANGNVVEKRGSDGRFACYRYDELDRIIKAENNDTVVSFEYDHDDRIIRETQGPTTIRYKYDQSGLRTELLIEEHGKTISYMYDQADRLISVIDPESGRYDFVYDELNQVIRRNFPNKVKEMLQYDVVGHIVEQKIEGPKGNLINQRVFLFRSDDRLGSVIDLIRGRKSYSYDARGNLLGVDYSDRAESFEYDAARNVISKNKRSLWQYSSGNRLFDANSIHLEYDSRGNVSKKNLGETVVHYSYNSENRLVKIVGSDNSTIEYKYDPFGRRIEKRTKDSVTRFIWDNHIMLYEETDGRLRRYLFHPEGFEPMSCTQANGSFYYHLDQVGMPIEVTDSEGNLIWKLDYEAFGNPIGEVPDFCLFRFLGQYYDIESGLNYNRFRYYDPQIGRFISPDPLEYEGGNNFYLYQFDPINWVDPMGLAKCKPPKRVDPNDLMHISAAEAEAAVKSVRRKAERNLKKAGALKGRNPTEIGRAIHDEAKRISRDRLEQSGVYVDRSIRDANWNTKRPYRRPDFWHPESGTTWDIKPNHGPNNVSSWQNTDQFKDFKKYTGGPDTKPLSYNR